MPRADGPFKVLEKINENAYKLDLPAKFRVSPTFNVADLKPYLGDDDEVPSRTTSIQEGGMMRTSLLLLHPPQLLHQLFHLVLLLERGRDKLMARYYRFFVHMI